MVKDLSSLIRLNEWMVDQHRRELSDVLNSLQSLEKGLQKLETDLKLEQQSAQSSPNEAGLLYGSYATSVILKRDSLMAGILKMEEKVSEARARLDGSYRELKKFEITQENRDLEISQEADRKESNEMNELALQVHRLKSS